MPKRKRKIFSRPRKLYDKARITEEDEIVKRYGLKSKREIWKADSAISKIRNLAKSLITKSEEEKNAFVNRLKEKGFNVKTIPDVLALNKEDWLKRRLQSIVVKKGITKTYGQARQIINHKHIIMEGKIIDSPSHLTTLEEEKTVETRLALPEKKLISDEEKQILKQIKPKEKEEKTE